MIERTKPKKPTLITGLLALTLCLCIIFPYEYRKASFITDLKYTYFTLAVAIFMLMYSFMGKHFFKGLSFLFFSCIFGIAAWFIYLPSPNPIKTNSEFFKFLLTLFSFFNNFAAVYMGIVTGIIAGLIFLVINAWLLKNENRYKLFFLRLGSYLIIFSIVFILFAKGGDWIFEISAHFKAQ